MDLFTYLMTKKGHNLSTHGDLFSYLLGKASQLPSEYQRLEYIESTGTQYIDTGRKSTPNTKFDFTYLSNKVDGSEFQNIFGSQSMPEPDIRKNRIYILIGSNERIQLQFPHNGNNVLYMLDNGAFTTQSNITAYNYIKISNNEKPHIVYDLPNRKVTVNEYTSFSISTYELTSSDYNILIFNRNEETIPTTNLATGRLYNFKWYENGKLVMNFIPCLRILDNEVGLYDTVGRQFYTNAGTGKFAYKGYTFIEYIEGTGTQYINALTKPNSNTDLEIKVQIMGSGTQRIFGVNNPGKVYFIGQQSSGNKIIFNLQEIIDTPNNRITSNVVGYNTGIHTIKIKNKELFVDNVSYGSLSTRNFDNTQHSAHIFDATGSTGSYAKMKLYYCKVYRGNVIGRDFIPAIRNSDNVAGLYDLANDTFYENAGTGTFITPTSQLNSMQSLNTNLLNENTAETRSIAQSEEPLELDNINEIEEPIEEEVS